MLTTRALTTKAAVMVMKGRMNKSYMNYADNTIGRNYCSPRLVLLAITLHSFVYLYGIIYMLVHPHTYMYQALIQYTLFEPPSKMPCWASASPNLPLQLSPWARVQVASILVHTP